MCPGNLRVTRAHGGTREVVTERCDRVLLQIEKIIKRSSLTGLMGQADEEFPFSTT
jgi:hypothetical protein